MQGLMMGYQLTVPAMLRRAEKLFADKEISSRRADKTFHRYTYAEFARRSKKLAVGLRQLGIQPGDRVATLCWNHHRHLEAYFGIPCAGAVLHTLNLRLAPDDLAYIIDHAGDRALLVDESLLPLIDRVRERVNLEHVVVLPEGQNSSGDDLDYEQLLESADEADFSYPEPDENEACAMCYTSGTTGNPKGAVYSHRAIVLHSLVSAIADSISIMEPDAVMPMVPMFHVNAWGIPFIATLVGARQVFPGPHLDPQSWWQKPTACLMGARACYGPRPRTVIARESIKQAKATKCKPATSLGQPLVVLDQNLRNLLAHAKSHSTTHLLGNNTKPRLASSCLTTSSWRPAEADFAAAFSPL